MHNAFLYRDFDQSISALRGDVLTMAAMTRHNLERAIRALLERSVEMANAVIADDDEVDECERKIDQRGMEIFLHFHPVATDLRLVMSSMKISLNLKSMANHATSIAQRAKKISAGQNLPDSVLIEPLYTLADHLLRDAISAYSDRNAVLGASLAARGKELDRMHDSATTTISSRIEQTHGRRQDLLQLIFVTRSLERVGDLAVGIGEEAVFLDSTPIMHHEMDRQRV
jgi:phosphate transport system protein